MSRENQILAEIQSRYRSDRFNSIGDRFGVHPQPSPEVRRERELKRINMLEERRVDRMYQKLGGAMGMTANEMRYVMGATDEKPQGQ